MSTGGAPHLPHAGHTHLPHRPGMGVLQLGIRAWSRELGTLTLEVVSGLASSLEVFISDLMIDYDVLHIDIYSFVELSKMESI